MSFGRKPYNQTKYNILGRKVIKTYSEETFQGKTKAIQIVEFTRADGERFRSLEKREYYQGIKKPNQQWDRLAFNYKDCMLLEANWNEIMDILSFRINLLPEMPPAEYKNENHRSV